MRRMERRAFIKFCAASAAVTGTPAVAADAQPRYYQKARLVDENGAALHAGSVPPNRNLIFLYPYVSTPCFLLNLGRPAKASARLKTVDERSYEWTGGVGPRHALVAYSAICAHKLTYPTRDISFISYRTEKSARNRFGNVIHCCSEHSQYDPAEGARVVAGPAPQPLACSTNSSRSTPSGWSSSTAPRRARRSAHRAWCRSSTITADNRSNAERQLKCWLGSGAMTPSRRSSGR